MRWSVPIVLALLRAVPATAQQDLPPDLLSDWQRNRSAVLAYIDAMPDSATGSARLPASGRSRSSSTTS